MDFDPKKNYYEILWVDENATEDEIKKAFKKLAVKYHPDRKWWSKEKFQEINEAYQILSDKKKRQQYDLFRKWWFDPSWFWGFGWWWDFQVDFWWIDLWDLVWDLFWWFWRHYNTSRQVRRWEDVQIDLLIDFKTAFLWATKTIQYTRRVVPKWVVQETCEVCKWTWYITQQVRTPFGIMQTSKPCHACKWTWKIYKKDWKIVHWLELVKETIEVKIPAWIKDWAMIKFAWKGDEIFGWEPWDLYVRIKIKKDDKFERIGNDLYTKADVTIFDLVLWWEIEVDHPEWKIKVKIPKWTQVYNKIKVSWKWFPTKWLIWSRWDLFITPVLHIPKKLTKEQEQLWKQLREIS